MILWYPYYISILYLDYTYDTKQSYPQCLPSQQFGLGNVEPLMQWTELGIGDGIQLLNLKRLIFWSTGGCNMMELITTNIY